MTVLVLLIFQDFWNAIKPREFSFCPPQQKRKKTKTNTHYHIHKYGDTLRHVNESCLFCMITEETAAYSARLRSNMFLFIALSSLQ